MATRGEETWNRRPLSRQFQFLTIRGVLVVDEAPKDSRKRRTACSPPATIVAGITRSGASRSRPGARGGASARSCVVALGERGQVGCKGSGPRLAGVVELEGAARARTFSQSAASSASLVASPPRRRVPAPTTHQHGRLIWRAPQGIDSGDVGEVDFSTLKQEARARLGASKA
jgi:hypothetical protein